MNRLAAFGPSVATLLALVVAWQTFRATPDRVRQIRRKESDLAALRDLKREGDLRLGVMQLWETSGPGPTLSERPGLAGADLQPRKDEPLINGWKLESADVVFEDQDLGDAVETLRVLETDRPPWRLAELVITPGPAAGRGRVAAVVETIRRTANP